MNIIEKLKNLGVEITPEIEKELGGDYVTKQEMTKKLEKVEILEHENEKLKESQINLEKELQTLKDNAPDVDGFNTKIAELTETLEKERKERAEKDEIARLDGLVSDFMADKSFVNEITKNAIKSQLVNALNSDTARGKSINDLFDGIIKDADGNIKENILITETEQELAKKRSGIVGAQINKQNGAKLTTAEIMKLKNQNPNLDISSLLGK